MRITCLSLIVLILTASPVLAHQKREVAGKYVFVVGFVNEPAFTGEMNGVDLRVLKAGSNEPVEGVEKSLQVTVVREKEQKSVKLPFRTRYKDPGRYAAYFLPTQPGSYIFMIEGKINGLAVAEKFQSGKDHFHDVEEAVKFP